MSQVLTVSVTCDEQLSRECAGLYREDVPELHRLDTIGTRMWRSGWHRGYGMGGEVAAAWDVCPSCWLRIMERQAKAPEPAETKPSEPDPREE